VATPEKSPYTFKVALRGKATEQQRTLVRAMAQTLADLDGVGDKSKYGESGSVSLLEAADVADEPLSSFTLALELETAQTIPAVLRCIQQTIERMDDVLEAAISVTLQVKLTEENPALDLAALGVEQVEGA
jgi:hypothetical protein